MNVGMNYKKYAVLVQYNGTKGINFFVLFLKTFYEAKGDSIFFLS